MPVTAVIKKHEKCEAAHAPGKAHAHRVAPHLGRVQMEKDVGRHHHYTVTRSVLVAVPEDRLPHVAFDDVFFNFLNQAHVFIR